MNFDLMLSPFGRKTAKAFNAWATDYERKAKEMLRRRGYTYRILASRIMDNLRIKAGDVILEIGTGPGVLGVEINNGLSTELVGVDISHEMLGLAQQHQAYSALNRANVKHLPFSSNSFDGIFSAFVLHSVWDQRSALREIRRILKPKSTVVLVDLYPIGRSLWRSVLMGVGHSLWHEHGAPARYVPVEHLVRLSLEEGFIVKTISPIGTKKTYSHFLVALERSD